MIENTPDVITKINFIRQQVLLLGGNDREPSLFEEILHLLDKNEISGEEAIRRAEEILSSKQDYH